MILFWFWLILYNPQSPFKISANDSVSTIVLWVTNKLGGYYLGSYLLAGLEEGGKRALILTKNYANMPCTRESQRLHVGFMSSPALRYMRDLCGLWECVWTVFGFSFLMPDWCPTMSNCSFPVAALATLRTHHNEFSRETPAISSACRVAAGGDFEENPAQDLHIDNYWY